MMLQQVSAVTFGQLVDEIGGREHRIRNALNRLGINPVRRAGSAFLYPPETTERVRGFLAELDAHRAAIDVRRATSQQPERRGDGDV